MYEINFIGKLNDRTFSVTRHQHRLWEFVYCTGGEGRTTMYNLNTEFEFQTGDMLVIPPGVQHGDVSEHGFTNIHFTVTHCPLFRTPVLFRDREEKLLQILNQTFEAFHLPPENSKELLSALTDVIFAYAASFAQRIRKNPYVEAMKLAVVEHGFSPDFDLAEVYDAVPFNREYARQLFVRETGTTPLNFLTEMRIDYAKRLLQFQSLTDYSVKEVAAMSGYSDALYFSRVFKKLTGSSPVEFRIGPQDRR